MYVHVNITFCLCNILADTAYLDRNSYTVLQPTAWIPLLDVNADNGCMQVQTCEY